MVARFFQWLRTFYSDAGKKASRNLFLLGLFSLLSQCSLLGIMLLSAWKLAPSDFGIFIFAITMQGYLFLIGSAGSHSIVVRDITRHPENIDQITASYITLTTLCSFFAAIFVATTALLVPLGETERIVIILFATAGITPALGLYPFFDAHHLQARSMAGICVIDLCCLVLVAVVWQLQQFSLLFVGLVLAGKWVIGTIIQYMIYHCSVRRLHVTFGRAGLADLARSSIPIFISYLFCVLPLTVGVFFLRVLAGTETTALFGLACQAGSLVYSFGWLGIRILQPHIAGPVGIDSRFLVKLIFFLTLYLVTLILLAYIGGYLAISFVLDPIYQAALEPLAAMIATGAIIAWGIAASLYLVRFHEERRVLWIYLLSGICYIGMGIYAIPRSGMRGAMLVSLFSAVIASVLMSVRACQLIFSNRGPEDQSLKTTGP